MHIHTVYAVIPHEKHKSNSDCCQGCGGGAQAILDGWSQKLLMEPEPEIWLLVTQP